MGGHAVVEVDGAEHLVDGGAYKLGAVTAIACFVALLYQHVAGGYLFQQVALLFDSKHIKRLAVGYLPLYLVAYAVFGIVNSLFHFGVAQQAVGGGFDCAAVGVWFVVGIGVSQGGDAPLQVFGYEFLLFGVHGKGLMRQFDNPALAGQVTAMR